MKLPKWLVAGLLVLSIGTPLVAAAWWWLNWPDQTMREFMAHVEAGQFEVAGGMIAPPLPAPYDGVETMMLTDERDRATSIAEDCGLTLSRESFETRPRTPIDIALGRRRFFLRGYYHTSDLEFTAHRGKVKCRNPE